MKRRTGNLWGSLLVGIFLGTWAGLALAAAAADAEGSLYRLRVNGISCPFCAYGIEKKLGALDGVETVEIRLDEGGGRAHAPRHRAHGGEELHDRLGDHGNRALHAGSPPTG